ncbi:LysR family transcriptional regulator [Bartonella sp. HY329]|uniref:LysR family transcriptional regulator n=1 Tax=unclassified Bartonella TaxID=2645622 RepID=UPI0021C84791|nr:MULTISPECIES: LysR family transcriptional regulator [unclassified Bartonella]UXM95079.1 LysR family transcriptional regulator [Bartonella sp. HY329]UXN09402.1 LysR family transcriptional regulator [Bartonella sp. HY328]
MKLTLRQIECFIAVAGNGNFSRAAQALSMAQSALSQAIRELEESLGLKLFDRTTRRVELTEAGREFFISARKIHDDIDLAVARLSDLAAKRRGRLRIAAVPMLAAIIMPKVFSAFEAIYPDIELILHEESTEVIIEKLRENQIDCAVGTFPAIDNDCSKIALTSDKLMVFHHIDNPLAIHDIVSWDMLGHEKIITLVRESTIRQKIEVGFATNHIPFTPHFEFKQIGTVLAFVTANIGSAVLPGYARAVIDDNLVKVKPLVNPIITRDISLIRNIRKTPSPALQAFQNVLSRIVRELEQGQSYPDIVGWE